MGRTPEARAAPEPTERRSEKPAIVDEATFQSAAADALLAEVRGSIGSLGSLLEHGPLLGPAVVSTIQATLQDVERRLGRAQLAMVVVGEKQAGKTTFLNALLGDRVLGAATTERTAVTFIRRADEIDYVARMIDGEVEQFSKLTPDRSAEIAARAAEARRERGAIAEDRARLARRADDTAEGLARDEAVLKEGFAEFEVRRDEAARVGAELGPAEQRAVQAEEAVRAIEPGVPAVLRAPPAAWAIWLWVLRGIFALVRWSLWRAYVARAHERDEALGYVTDLRKLGTRAAEACREAETFMAPTAARVEQGRRALGALRRDIAELDAKMAKLEATERACADELTVHHEKRRTKFFEDVKALTDVDARGRRVAELELAYPARHLPDDVLIIDAPGATDESDPAHERSWAVIREEADGCILLSELSRGVSDSTKRFLQRLRAVVPHVLLVLTKMDKPFFDAIHKGEAAPWEKVERARRIGTRRFAREVGREPDQVLSVSVAAEAALKKGDRTRGFARQFEQNAVKLFQLLRHERALMLGARAAAAIRRCIGAIAEAQPRAEAAYKARIAALEAHRVPDPGEFSVEQLQRAEPAVGAAASAIAASALEVLAQGVAVLRAHCDEQIAACRNRAQLESLLPNLEAFLGEGTVKLTQEVHVHLETRADRATREIERGIFDELRRRYQLAHAVTRDSASRPQIDRWEVSDERCPLALAPKAKGALRSFVPMRVGLGLGGAAAGAAVGTLVLPGIGTAVGAAVGAFLNFARTLGSVKRSCSDAVARSLVEPEQALTRQIQESHAVIAASIRSALERSVAHVIERFGRWIAEPIEAERQAIQAERAKLSNLKNLREGLEAHDGRLEVQIKLAADSSVGLCR